jgi:hypothetical protein
LKNVEYVKARLKNIANKLNINGILKIENGSNSN